MESFGGGTGRSSFVGTFGKSWASAVLGVGDDSPRRSMSAELTAPRYPEAELIWEVSLPLGLLEKRLGIVCGHATALFELLA